MNDLTVQTKARAPAVQNRAQADLLGVYRNAIEETAGHFSISDRLAPSESDRRALELRRGEIVQTSARSDARAVAQRVARLFMRFPSTRLAEGQAEATIAAYAADLAHFPLWAIDAGCMAVITGQSGSSKAFAPSSVELRSACDKAMDPVRTELADLNRVLDAAIYHEPTADEKAATLALFQELVADLKLNVDPRDRSPLKSRPSTRAEAQAFLERAEPDPNLKFSGSLADKLGLRPDRQEDAA